MEPNWQVTQCVVGLFGLALPARSKSSLDSVEIDNALFTVLHMMPRDVRKELSFVVTHQGNRCSQMREILLRAAELGWVHIDGDTFSINSESLTTEQATTLLIESEVAETKIRAMVDVFATAHQYWLEEQAHLAGS